MPLFCALDEVMIAFQHGVLHRKQTIDAGGDYCDYFITSKREEKKKKQYEITPRFPDYSASRHLRQRLAFLRRVRMAEMTKNAMTAAMAASVSTR